MIKICSLLPLCLIASIQAAAIPPVQYWTDEARSGWIAAACQVEGASRLTLIQPDGTPSYDLVTEKWKKDQAVALLLLKERNLPTSPWWHRGGALHELLDTTQAKSPTFIWQQMGNRSIITMSADEEEPKNGSAKDPSSHNRLLPSPNLKLEILAEALPLGTEDSLIEASGLRFFLPEAKGLGDALHATFRNIHRSHDQRIRQREVAESMTDRPSEIVHELRLLSWTPRLCTALVITKSRRLYASTSIALNSINLRRGSDDQWLPYDPLAGEVDRIQLRETIRAQLNRQQANGDRFYEDYTDPLGDEARAIYTPLRIGQRLYLLFEPYTIAPGAWGIVTINAATYESAIFPSNQSTKNLKK